MNTRSIFLFGATSTYGFVHKDLPFKILLVLLFMAIVTHQLQTWNLSSVGQSFRFPKIGKE